MDASSRVNSPMVKQNPEKFSSLAYALSKSIVRYPPIKEANIAMSAGPKRHFHNGMVLSQ
jgi:hypothetical protein